jgi:hypothetical protein
MLIAKQRIGDKAMVCGKGAAEGWYFSSSL